MSKKKHVILFVLAFCLVAALFVGVTISQNGTLQSATPEKGYVSVPAAAFGPRNGSQNYWRGHTLKNYDYDPDTEWFYAPVQFPHGATLTNFTSVWVDGGGSIVGCALYRLGRLLTVDLMTSADSPPGPAGLGSSYNNVINYATVDNSQYTYYLIVLLPPSTIFGTSYSFICAHIEYEYPTPPITPETRYQDASIWVDLTLLPGTRINLFAQNEIQITAGDVSHVQHGFVTDHPWSEMSEEEQTVFLSTTEFHLYVNDAEVPTTHITRHDSVDDNVYSLYYRVFPPGYFELNRLHRLRGEWYMLNYTSGEWVTFVREGTLRVLP